MILLSMCGIVVLIMSNTLNKGNVVKEDHYPRHWMGFKNTNRQRKAHVITTNTCSPRFMYSLKTLQKVGFSKIIPIDPIKYGNGDELSKVMSNKKTFLYSLEKFINDRDEWLYIFEDDIDAHNDVSMKDILELEKKSALFFYLGICFPINKSIRTPPSCGRCAHAMAFSKRGAQELLKFEKTSTKKLQTQNIARNEPYFDVIIEGWCNENGKFNVLKQNKMSPENVGHRGAFFQARKQFPSTISLSPSHKSIEGENNPKQEKVKGYGPGQQESLEYLTAASGSDKARIGNGEGYHGYTRYYERIFKAIRESPVRLVEIGVENGRSMKMWQQYFSEAEHIYGIGYGNFQVKPSQDCNSDAATRVNSKTACTIYKGDQSDIKFLKRFIGETRGDFDIIIDDGSHLPSHQLISFETLWPAIRPGGMYVVEDIETNWWKPTASIYGYSLQNQPNVVDIWKGLIESVNREFTSGHSKLTDKKPEVYGSVVSVEFGQNIIIFHKALKNEEFMLSKKYRYQHKLSQ